jgi:hypothetical protein
MRIYSIKPNVVRDGGLSRDLRGGFGSSLSGGCQVCIRRTPRSGRCRRISRTPSTMPSLSYLGYRHCVTALASSSHSYFGMRDDDQSDRNLAACQSTWSA